MAGSLAGHYLFDKFSGHGSEENAASNATSNDASNPCMNTYKDMMGCFQANENDISQCQWIYGQFSSCTKNNQTQQN